MWDQWLCVNVRSLVGVKVSSCDWDLWLGSIALRVTVGSRLDLMCVWG